MLHNYIYNVDDNGVVEEKINENKNYTTTAGANEKITYYFINCDTCENVPLWTTQKPKIIFYSYDRITQIFSKEKELEHTHFYFNYETEFTTNITLPSGFEFKYWEDKEGNQYYFYDEIHVDKV